MTETTEPKGYQGWTNYETWAVALWIGNDEGSYTHWEKDQAEECYRKAVEDSRDTTAGRDQWTNRAAEVLAARLEDELTENAPEVAGLYGDLLRAALGEVDWYEIAESYVEGLDRDAIEAEARADPGDEDEAAD